MPLWQENSGNFEPQSKATEVRLGRTFVDKLIIDHMEGANVMVNVSMGKYWTSEMAMRIAAKFMGL